MHNVVKFRPFRLRRGYFFDIIILKGVVRMKRIVQACIDELLKFENQSEADIFLRRLEYSPRKHRVESTVHCEDGTVLIRIKRQYNNAPLPDREE